MTIPPGRWQDVNRNMLCIQKHPGPDNRAATIRVGGGKQLARTAGAAARSDRIWL